MWKAAIAAAIPLMAASPALASLPVGAKAPEFSAPSFLAGAPQEFSMAAALKKGPVVLYFFPAAHTPGCNIEAHLFAQAIDKFHAAGATVVGITAGHVSEVGAFSAETEHCAGKFPVVADAGAEIAKAYDARLPLPTAQISNRTSYVIAPNDRVVFVYTNMKPDEHIAQTLAAVEKWRAEHAR